MKFKKLVKADENFDENKFNKIDEATHSIYKSLEGYYNFYKVRGLSKEDILSAIEEASIRLEEAADDL